MPEKIDKNLSDQDLVAKVLGGNTNAFSQIICNTEGLVAQITYKMIGIAEERKDIAQDIYLKVFQHLKSFRFQSKLSTWIAQIAYNTCRNYLEKKKLILLNNFGAEDNLVDPLADLSNKMHSLNNETENIINKKELKHLLNNEMNKLSPVYQTLITLYHHEELSYEEISEITSLPEGTVKNYLFRARKTLRENLLLQYKKDAL